MGITRVTLLLVMVVVGSITPLLAQGQHAALLETDQRAAQLASDSGLAASLRQNLHRDGVLLWPGAPVLLGATQVNAFLARWPRTTPVRLTWQPLAVELSRDSALAALWGVVAVSPNPPETGAALGRFISVWQRDRGGWSMSASAFIGISVPGLPPVPSGVPLSHPLIGSAQPARPFVEADLAFARLARDSGAAIAFRTWADDDALIFGAGGLLSRGPAAIARAVEGPERWDWHPIAAGTAGTGDLGWTVGEAIITGSDGKPSYSKYVTIWARREAVIRFLLDGGNARPPAR